MDLSFGIKQFMMYIEVDNLPVHYVTQLALHHRMADLVATDTAPWRTLYPEWEYLLSQPYGLVEDVGVLICKASINISAECRPHASLSIVFCLETRRTLDFHAVESVN